MKSLSSSLLLLSLCAITVSATGCDDSSPAGFDDPVEAQAAITDVWCDTAHACKEDYPAELAAFLPFEVFFGTTPAACRSNLAASEQDVSDLRAAIAANRTSYHADRAATCHEALTSLTCDQMWAEDSMSSACENVYVGTIPNGGACAVNVECVSQDCEEGVCVEDN